MLLTKDAEALACFNHHYQLYQELCQAVRDQDVGRVKSLLEDGAEPNLLKHTVSPLCFATCGENRDIPKYLLATGADYNLKMDAIILKALGKSPNTEYVLRFLNTNRENGGVSQKFHADEAVSQLRQDLARAFDFERRDAMRAQYPLFPDGNDQFEVRYTKWIEQVRARSAQGKTGFQKN